MKTETAKRSFAQLLKTVPWSVLVLMAAAIVTLAPRPVSKKCAAFNVVAPLPVVAASLAPGVSFAATIVNRAPQPGNAPLKPRYIRSTKMRSARVTS